METKLYLLTHLIVVKFDLINLLSFAKMCKISKLLILLKFGYGEIYYKIKTLYKVKYHL